jgi:hypothetical protein
LRYAEDAMRSLPLLALGALTGLAGCGETALDLRLLPTLRLNTERQVLAAARTLRLTLDAAGGFAGARSPGAHGSFTAKDVDGDGALELYVVRELAGRSELPRFRLLAGQDRDRPFTAIAEGLAVGEELGAAGRRELRFVAGEVAEVELPFDLRYSHLPLRVIFTSPLDQEVAVPPSLAEVVVWFSKEVDPGSLDGNLRLLYRGKVGDRPVPGSWTLESSSLSDLGVVLRQSRATLSLRDCTLSPGTYRIVVGAGLRDRGLAQLDQDPTRDGADPYEGQFVVAGAAGADAEPCRPQPQQCTKDADCNPPTFACDTKRGQCVRAGGGECGAPCPADHVCDAEGAPFAACVRDCRSAGCAAGQSCDAKTGLCSCGPSAPADCGTVSEEVTCRFVPSGFLAPPYECHSAKGSCSATTSNTCKAKARGKKGEKVLWQSEQCSGKPSTTIDGKPEEASFSCP